MLAVMTGAFALSLTLVVVTLTVVTTQDSGVDRQRAVAVSAAEAGIDATYAVLQASGTTLPCRWPATGSLNARGTDATEVVVEITYYRADGSEIACSGGTISEQPAKAELVSTADTTPLSSSGIRGTRTMQSLVDLSPEYASSMDDAIFSNGKLEFANYSSLSSTTGESANVYSNDAVLCSNGNSTTVFDGNWTAQGSVTLSNRCEVTGDLWVKGSVTLSGNKSTVDGYVRTSDGTVTAFTESPTHTMVGKLVQAPAPVSPQTMYDQIHWDTCWADAGRTTLADPARCQWPATVPAPPVKPFPIIRGDATAQAAWAAAGYTVIKDTDTGMDPSCTNPDQNGRNWITDWVISHASTLTGKTLLVVTCPDRPLRFDLKGSEKVELKNDLALFSYSGFETVGRVIFDSADGAGHTLHLITPYDATLVPTTCQTPTIELNNQTTIRPVLATLLYSPCDMAVANNAEFNGQVYGGAEISVNNQFTMQFTQVPMPDGAVTVPEGGAISSYSLDVVYKREIRNA